MAKYTCVHVCTKRSTPQFTSTLMILVDKQQAAVETLCQLDVETFERHFEPGFLFARHHTHSNLETIQLEEL
eukprot:m.148996 g.148996  ORF g.148996 m.148996 type:complete len:72 (+) comp14199_c0_seq1:244-459(+)